MLSVAKRLVENESFEIFELTHNITDNVLNKIYMLIGIEKNREDLVYYNKERLEILLLDPKSFNSF